MKKLSLALVVCLIVAFGFCGCGGPTPTQTADTFLTAVKAGDTETIKTVYDGKSFDVLAVLDEDSEGDASDEDIMEDDELVKMLIEKMQDFDYELSNEKIDGDKATVDVKITTYNIGNAFTAFMTEYFTQAFALAFSDAADDQIEELANTILETKLNELKDKDYSETVTLNLVNKDDGWKVAKIKNDSDFYNAVTGGLVKAFESLEDAFSFDE